MPFTLAIPQMMTNPITPPPELVQEWWDKVPGTFTSLADETHLATQAAQWGADQELEACCEWLGDAPVVYNDNADLHPGSYLRDARRPKPPSLKEQALALLDDASDRLDAVHENTIRRALEALDD